MGRSDIVRVGGLSWLSCLIVRNLALVEWSVSLSLATFTRGMIDVCW